MKNPKLITFETFFDADAVAWAKLGDSNKAIMKAPGLTSGQITYRLSKAKGLEGNKSGYRVAWRNGESQEFMKVAKDMLKVIRVDIQRRLPVLIEHPEPKIVNVPNEQRH